MMHFFCMRDMPCYERREVALLQLCQTHIIATAPKINVVTSYFDPFYKNLMIDTFLCRVVFRIINIYLPASQALKLHHCLNRCNIKEFKHITVNNIHNTQVQFIKKQCLLKIPIQIYRYIIYILLFPGFPYFQLFSLTTLYTTTVYALITTMSYFTVRNRITYMQEQTFLTTMYMYIILMFHIPYPFIPFTLWTQIKRIVYYMKKWAAFQVSISLWCVKMVIK